MTGYVDPDNQIGKGVSGADVVQENLRQLCIWDDAKTTLQTDGGAKWWDYSIQFAAECKGTGTVSTSFSTECSQRVHDEVGLSWATTLQCVSDAGGYGPDDGVNTRIQAEIDARTGQKRGNIFTLPSIIVNEIIARGGVKPDGVLQMICAGFLEGTAPDQLCDPEATKDKAFAEKLAQASAAIAAANKAAAEAQETANDAKAVVDDLKAAAEAAEKAAADATAQALAAQAQLGTLRQASIDAKNAAEEAQAQADKKVGMASIVMIVLLSMVVLGAAGFFWHRRSQQAARQEVTGMLAQYFTPLAEGSGSSSGGDRTGRIEFPSRGPAFQPPATTTSKDAALKDLAADAGAATDVAAV